MNKKSVIINTFLLLVLCSMFSCRDKNNIRIPSGIVQPDTMVSVLADVHLLQAAAQLGYSEHAGDTSIQLAWQRLYKKHNLNAGSYNSNMQFYCDHPALLDSVYEKVLSTLNQRKAELMGPEKKPGKQAK